MWKYFIDESSGDEDESDKENSDENEDYVEDVEQGNETDGDENVRSDGSLKSLMNLKIL